MKMKKIGIERKNVSTDTTKTDLSHVFQCSHAQIKIGIKKQSALFVATMKIGKVVVVVSEISTIFYNLVSLHEPSANIFPVSNAVVTCHLRSQELEHLRSRVGNAHALFERQELQLKVRGLMQSFCQEGS